MVLLTSLGMCGLKLNTGLLSGKPGALSYLFCIFMKTLILCWSWGPGGGSSSAFSLRLNALWWQMLTADCWFESVTE